MIKTAHWLNFHFSFIQFSPKQSCSSVFLDMKLDTIEKFTRQKKMFSIFSSNCLSANELSMQTLYFLLLSIMIWLRYYLCLEGTFTCLQEPLIVWIISVSFAIFTWSYFGCCLPLGEWEVFYDVDEALFSG